jgi:hypothetical protein
LPLYEESLRIRTKVFGDEHPDVAESLNNLAELLQEQVIFTNISTTEHEIKISLGKL